jgi:hypothetical protein
VVARRHGIESLLYNWRSAWKAAACVVSASETVNFVPLGVVGETAGRDGPHPRKFWPRRGREPGHSDVSKPRGHSRKNRPRPSA